MFFSLCLSYNFLPSKSELITRHYEWIWSAAVEQTKRKANYAIFKMSQVVMTVKSFNCGITDVFY